MAVGVGVAAVVVEDAVGAGERVADDGAGGVLVDRVGVGARKKTNVSNRLQLTKNTIIYH